MSGIATAVVGSAVIGGIASRNASKSAARSAKQGSDAQLAFMKQQADQARGDINRLFPQATDKRNQAYQQQMDTIGRALPTTMNFMQQGNVGAQNILAGSMPQIQNAILGGKIDYGFMQPQKIDYESQIQELLAGNPKVYDQAAKDAAAQAESDRIQHATANQPQQYPNRNPVNHDYDSQNNAIEPSIYSARNFNNYEPNFLRVR